MNARVLDYNSMPDVPCQRWRPDRTPAWRRTSEGGFDPARYGVAGIDRETAKNYVTRHHYSGTYPAGRLMYGLYDLAGEAPELCGAEVLSVPASTPVLTNVFPHLEPFGESLELGRLVLAEEVPANGESWFVAEAFRLAAAEGIRGVVSFSDPVARYDTEGRVTMPGHIGIVYQALNAAHIGRSTVRTHWVLPDGTVFSPRAMQKIRAQDQGHEYSELQLIAAGARPMRAGEDPRAWLAEALTATGARTIRHPGCIRYAFTTGSRSQRRAVHIAPERQPYPKMEALVLAA